MDHDLVSTEPIYTRNDLLAYRPIGHVVECLKCNGVWLETVVNVDVVAVNVFGDEPTPCPGLSNTVHQHAEPVTEQPCWTCAAYPFVADAECPHRIQQTWAGADYDCNCVMCQPVETHEELVPIYGGRIYRNTEKEEKEEQP